MFNRKREIKTRSQSGGVHQTVDGSHKTIRNPNALKLLQRIQATGASAARDYHHRSLCLFVFLALLHSGAQQLLGAELARARLYYQPVVYRENHDPSMVFMQGGQDYEVRYGKVSLEEVEGWKSGK